MPQYNTTLRMEKSNVLYAGLISKDTINGKLYKYRSFDKNEYALVNLNDGTLHCSKPSEFNDPFDCKIGITFNSIYGSIKIFVFDCTAIKSHHILERVFYLLMLLLFLKVFWRDLSLYDRLTTAVFPA